MKVIFKSFILLAFSANVASAETLQDCIDTADNSQRLACYDRIFGHSKSSNSIVSDNYSNNNPSSYGKPEDSFGAKKLESSNQLDEITSTIPGSHKSWKTGKKVTLSNGQVWKISGTANIYYPVENPKVTISKAILGSFNMNIDGVNKTFKVKRIK